MPGIDTERVVSEIDPELVCELCNRVFLDPVANVCPHIFCYSCIRKRLQSKGSRECPTCSTALNETPDNPPESLLIKLSNVEIKCPKNCDTVVLVKDVKRHTDEQCPNAPVRCPNSHIGCNETPKRHQVANHQNECGFRYVNCDACGHKTLHRDLYTHQKNKRCLERKLRREVVKNLRHLNMAVENHRHEIQCQHVRLHHEEREQIQKHRYKMNSEFGKGSQLNIASSISDASETSSTESSPRNFCNSPRYDPSKKLCQRCKKYFTISKNNKHACSWHQGPVLELFGGTCHACGRLDVQKGCVTGCHLTGPSSSGEKDKMIENGK